MNESKYAKKIFYLLTGLVFAFAMLTPNIGNATTYYVATTGNDSNPGTKNSPWRNITFGVSSLSAGDTLYVKAGTYRESILSWKTTIPNGTSWENPVTVAAYPGDKVTIHPHPGKPFLWVQDGQAKYLIIDGFIIDGQHQGTGFNFSNHSQYIRVQRTEIKNSRGDGIIVTICAGCADDAKFPHDTYHEFIELNVHHSGVGTESDHGFYINTSYNLVEKSMFHHNTGNGGKFFHGNLKGVANHNIARYNQFFNNSLSGKSSCGLILSSGDSNVAYNNIAYGQEDGFCVRYRVTNAHLYNNISYGNDHYGIYVAISGTDGTRVENNTVYKNGLNGIFVAYGASNTKIINNISYLNGDNSSGSNIGLRDEVGTEVFSNLTSNPMFENAAGGDFRLKAGSPAIDKGDTIRLISNDFEGTSRPQGSSHDIGAYERISNLDNQAPTPPKSVSIK